MRKRRRRYVSRRRRQERRKDLARRAVILTVVLLLAGLAMAPQLRSALVGGARRAARSVQAAVTLEEAQAEVTLPAMKVYALQLGAYDNGEHAQLELERLLAQGVPCMIWQREQMRLICDAAQSRDVLSTEAAQGHDAWTVEEEAPEVLLRIGADASQVDAVRELLLLPDELFAALKDGGEALDALTQRTRELAVQAQQAHPENLLYMQLAQSLLNWCTLMDQSEAAYGETAARAYARATMCTLCCELRQTLIAQSEASTA